MEDEVEKGPDDEVKECQDELFPDLETVTSDVEIPVVCSKLYGKLWAPQTLAEFATVVQSLTLQPHGDVSGWRGQSNLRWPLQPSAVRRLESQPRNWLLDDNKVTEVALRDYEERLLQITRLAGHGFAGGRTLSDLEVLGVLQHHGAATRLTDFTENAFIALWFAASARPKDYGIVFGVDLDNVWRIDQEALLKSSFRALLDEAEGRMTYWKPSALSPRMPAQAAFLLWSEVQARDWSSLGTSAAVVPDVPSNSVLSDEFVGIAVSPALKAYMQRRWADTLGYGLVTMYPDFDGFANAHGHATELPWDFFV